MGTQTPVFTCLIKLFRELASDDNLSPRQTLIFLYTQHTWCPQAPLPPYIPGPTPISHCILAA